MSLATLLPPGEDVDALLARLTDDEAREVDALLAAGPLTFREFAAIVNPRLVWYPYVERVAAVLERVANGELSRVLFLAPPRHGKSELVSRLFPAYLLYRFPERWVGLASYGAELAYTLSRNARAYYQETGATLAEDAATMKHWETGRGGGMWAAGFGGSLLGKGGHVLLFDDPIKNAEEANSPAIAERNKDWWGSTFYNRLEPGGAIVGIMQRWPGVADLIAYLFELEAGDHPERWHVVSLEAIKEAEPVEIPATCTLEPDPRPVGEALCPDRYPLDRLAHIRQQQGEYYFAAQFQQRPRPRDGVMFPRQQAPIVDALPAHARTVRGWDKAGSQMSGDYTAGVKLAAADGLYYVADVRRAQLASHDRKALMRQTAELDGRVTLIEIEQEPGSGGKDSAADDVKNLAGFTVRALPSTGDKQVRADPFAAQWQAGNVRLLRGDWNKAFLDELEMFPHGKHDDQVDAAAIAFNKLALGRTPFVV